MDIEHLKYPIGKFIMPNSVDQETIQQWISAIKLLPSKLEALSKRIESADYLLRYRPEGWTVQQVLHHMADSHMNAFIRVKLALTEENPVIKPYFEERWANTAEIFTTSPQESICLLKGLHNRWATLLEHCSFEQLNRTFYHPEHELSFPLVNIIGMYAWHGAHHLAHIELALEKRPE